MSNKLLGIIILVVCFAVAGSVSAAPPQKVTYHGAPVRTAVPGTPVTLKLQVKNTGSTTYSGVKVIIHVPDGVSHSAVTPGGADISDETITWSNVPLVANQSFYPAIALTIEKSVALGTKKNVWVEVTGEDMEASSSNFSLTAVTAGAKKAASTLSSSDITSIFQEIYGRTPTASERTYWLGRRTDKPQRTALQGAMVYHKAQNIKH